MAFKTVAVQFSTHVNFIEGVHESRPLSSLIQEIRVINNLAVNQFVNLGYSRPCANVHGAAPIMETVWLNPSSTITQVYSWIIEVSSIKHERTYY